MPAPVHPAGPAPHSILRQDGPLNCAQKTLLCCKYGAMNSLERYFRWHGRLVARSGPQYHLIVYRSYSCYESSLVFPTVQTITHCASPSILRARLAVAESPIARSTDITIQHSCGLHRCPHQLIFLSRTAATNQNSKQLCKKFNKENVVRMLYTHFTA